jgi:uncharacterized protein (DUF427 family)
LIFSAAGVRFGGRVRLTGIDFPYTEDIMPKAIWKNQVIAEAPSNEIHRVEGNVYFPPGAVKREFLRPSDTHTTCPWKGIASYYTLVVDGEENRDAAWYYPEPSAMAARIKDYVAFWHGVQVEE